MKILILEDNYARIQFFKNCFGGHDVMLTEESIIAIGHLIEEIFDLIFLDNDLGIGNGEGLDVANYLHLNPDNLNNQSTIIVHSWNTVAARQMKKLLPKAIVAPFSMKFFDDLRLTLD